MLAPTMCHPIPATTEVIQTPLSFWLNEEIELSRSLPGPQA